MKACLLITLLLTNVSALAAPVNDACDPIIKARTQQVMEFFTDSPKTVITVVSSVYKATPLEVIDGEIAKGETYKVFETVKVGKDSDSPVINVESGVIAPSKYFKDCQVLYTSPGKVNK